MVMLIPGDDVYIGADLAFFNSTAMETIMIGPLTTFTMVNGSTAQFLNVTLTSADLVFI